MQMMTHHGDDRKMAKMTTHLVVIKPSTIADDRRCN